MFKFFGDLPETSPFLSAQMAVLSSFLQVFIVLGIYNFGFNQAFFLEVDDYSEKSHGIIIFLGDFPTPTRFICYIYAGPSYSSVFKSCARTHIKFETGTIGGWGAQLFFQCLICCTSRHRSAMHYQNHYI